MRRGGSKLFLCLCVSCGLLMGTQAYAEDRVYIGDISGGYYTRQIDGINGELMTIKGNDGGDLNISGGSFSTASPQIYTDGVVTVRDDNIRLYNPNSLNPDTGLYSLHTPESVAEAYANGQEAMFAPANNPTAIPTQEEVLKALEGA